MGFFTKLQGYFFEDEEEEEEHEEEHEEQLATKVDVPKSKPVEIKHTEITVTPIELEEEPTEEVEVKVEVKEEPVIENKFTQNFFEDEEEDHEEEIRPLYPEKKEKTYQETVNKQPYSTTTTTYYESKETKTFTPSPIISPVFGILDKNYTKEEVVTKKKEIKITSYNSKPDLDEIRSRAYGDRINDEATPSSKELNRSARIENEKNTYKEIEPEKKIYDTKSDKPELTGISLAEADEYYRDLGLAYGEDYKDKSKEASKKKNEDNLFDLIESMYDKED